MGGFIDTLVAGFTGGMSGAGSAIAKSGEMDRNAELEERKADLAYQRQMLLKKADQEFERPYKDRAAAVSERSVAVSEGNAAESARHNAASEDLQGRQLEETRRYHNASLSEHAADRASRERLAKQQAKNITTLEDGTLATYDADTGTMNPVRDPATGNALKGPKDLSLSDKTKVAFLQSSILELQKERSKALDDTSKGSLDRDIADYRKQLYGILGMELSPSQSRGGGKPPGERRPLSAFGG